MRISPVIGANTFNGLWENVRTTQGSLGYASLTDGRYYHPFKDESDEFVKTIKPQSEHKREVIGFENPVMVDITKEVGIKPRLNITEGDYNIYKQEFSEGKPLSELGAFVEKELKLNNLLEYLNPQPSEPKETLLSSMKNTIKSMIKVIVGKRA